MPSLSPVHSFGSLEVASRPRGLAVFPKPTNRHCEKVGQMKGYGSAKRKVWGDACTFVLAAIRSDPIMMLFMAALGGAALGFLVYNFNPASIFMGDTGSMFIGYVFAVGSIQTSQKSSTAVAILVLIVALGLPIADTLLATIRRAVNHQPIAVWRTNSQRGQTKVRRSVKAGATRIPSGVT